MLTLSRLRQHAEAGSRVTLLTTLPGVGLFTALVLAAGVGGITRFPAARTLASWPGPRPRCAART